MIGSRIDSGISNTAIVCSIFHPVLRMSAFTASTRFFREALIKSPSEFLKSPMVQDEEEFPANTEVCKGESDEVLRHWVRNSDEKRFNQ